MDAAAVPEPAAGYRPLVMSVREERLSFATLHDDRLQSSREEADAGVDGSADECEGGLGGALAAARFDGRVWSAPSAYIAALVAGLPEDQ